MKAFHGLIVLVAACSVQGCAQAQVERDLDSKIAQETEVQNRTELGQQTKERISDAVGLTADQRTRLLALRDTTAKQLDQLTNESLRLRSLLVKDLIATDYNENEVNLIKGRIRNIEEKRVSTIFDAADQASQILGRDAVRNRRVFDDFFFEPRGRLDFSKDPHGHYN